MLTHTRQALFILCAALGLLSMPLFMGQAIAQTVTSTAGSIFETTVKVADASTLLADDFQITLWGVDHIDAIDPAFTLNGRTTLANAVGKTPVRCEVKKQEKTNAFRFNGATRYQSTQTFFRKRGGRT